MGLRRPALWLGSRTAAATSRRRESGLQGIGKSAFQLPFKNSCPNSLDPRRDLNGAKHLRREMYAPFAPPPHTEHCGRFNLFSRLASSTTK